MNLVFATHAVIIATHGECTMNIDYFTPLTILLAGTHSIHGEIHNHKMERKYGRAGR